MLLVEKKRESSNGSDAGYHQLWFVSERRVKHGNGGRSPDQENERVPSLVPELQSGHRLRPELRRAIHHDLVAEQANFGVALDIDGFVFAQFGLGGDEQRAVVYVVRPSSVRLGEGRGGVAGEENEIAPKAFGVHVHAVADALVEVQFDHVAGPRFEQERTERTENSFSVSSVCSCCICLRSGPVHWPGGYTRAGAGQQAFRGKSNAGRIGTLPADCKPSSARSCCARREAPKSIRRKEFMSIARLKPTPCTQTAARA